VLRTRLGTEWALQGSNSGQAVGGSSAPQDQVLQESVYRVVAMLLSGVAPDRVSLLLRSLAAALDAEAGVASRPVDGARSAG
jgi:hypothetical protein